MKIGITERGDAGLDFGWTQALEMDKVDGAILITKNLTPAFIKEVLRLYKNGKKFIIHAGCTGWGGTYLEPNVPPFKQQIDTICNLIEYGLPKENIVLRIDPIIPTLEGLSKVDAVINYAHLKGLITTDGTPSIRVRISIYDEYKHAVQRLHQAGHNPFYANGSFYASDEMFAFASNALSAYGITFETCAEPKLIGDAFKPQGCISDADLNVMNLTRDTDLTNMQNRNGCLCSACKTELLTRRHPCKNACLYCYWKD